MSAAEPPQDRDVTCAGCEHSLEAHVRTEAGAVRCFVSHSGVTSEGVIGIAYTTRCDCRDFKSDIADRKREQHAADERRWDFLKKLYPAPGELPGSNNPL
jgi:hypothetical protein